MKHINIQDTKNGNDYLIDVNMIETVKVSKGSFIITFKDKRSSPAAPPAPKEQFSNIRFFQRRCAPVPK